MTAPTLGVQLGDGSILFGAPWASHHDYGRRTASPAWLGGLTADEYARIIREAS